jgi:hypothetical protein
MSDARCPKCTEGRDFLFAAAPGDSAEGCRELVAQLVPGGVVTNRRGLFREFEEEVACAACGARWLFEGDRPSGGPRQGPFDTAPDALRLCGRVQG